MAKQKNIKLKAEIDISDFNKKQKEISNFQKEQIKQNETINKQLKELGKNNESSITNVGNASMILDVAADALNKVITGAEKIVEQKKVVTDLKNEVQEYNNLVKDNLIITDEELKEKHRQETEALKNRFKEAEQRIRETMPTVRSVVNDALLSPLGAAGMAIHQYTSGNGAIEQINKQMKEDLEKLKVQQKGEEEDFESKKREEAAKKEHEARLAREREYQRRRKAIQDEIQTKIAETDQLEEKNHFEQIKRNQAVATSIEEVTTSYDAEIDIVKQKSKEQADTEAKKYDDLIAKAKKYKLDKTQLEQDKADRITVIEQTAARDILSIETDKQAKIKAINDKAEEEAKTAAQKVMQEKQAVIELEKNLLDNYYSEIKNLQENADVKGAGGIIDVDATRANLDKVGASLEIYLEKLKDFKDKQIAHIGEAMANTKEGSVEHTKLLQQKAQVEQDYANKVKDVNKAIADNTKKTTGTTKEYWKAVAAKIQEHVEHIMTGVSAVFSAIKENIKGQLEEANEHFTAISEKYNAVVEQRKASNDKINALQEEAKNARGGYGMVLQEQINQEMAKNQELAQQEAQLAKEKEKAEKEKEKKEKQMKKAELSQNIIQGISNVALSITKALAAGPFIGQIMAGVAAAAGAVQVGILTKQLAKLEDGGLLRGKRHAQGGMRIEGTNIEVEGGEYVVNRESTNKNLGLVRYINSQRKALTSADLNNYFSKSAQGYETPLRRRFEAGGTLPAISNGSNLDNESLVDAIKSIKFAPKVAVTDIIRAQDELTQVDGWTGM